MPYTPDEVLRREAIIRQFKRGDISSTRAAQLLTCTPRQVRRLLRTLTERGTLAHPGHASEKKLSDDVEAAILRTFDANPRRNNQHIVDLLAAEGIETNRMTVKRVLERNERKKPAKPPQAYERFEHDAIGSLVYQDTSDHEWLLGSGSRVRCIADQDDHSRKIVFARFFQHDGVWQNMAALRYVVEQFGLPQTFFVDRASHFYGSERRSSWVSTKHPEAWDIQIARALDQLGVRLSHSTAYHPQSKGKLERLFGFMQGRLPHELGNISLVEANKQLVKWVYWYNAKRKHSATRLTPQHRWTVAKRNKRSLWVPVSPKVNLDDVFSFHDRRVVRKDNTFSYQGQTYRITGRGGWYIGKEVELHVVPPKKIRVFWLGQFVCEVPFQGAFKQPIT